MTLSKRLDELESRVAASSGSGDSTVVAMVSPVTKKVTKCLERVDGKWVETEKEPDAYFPEKLEPIFTRPKRFIVLAGGRGSSKSVSVGDKILIDMNDLGDSWMCIREFQASIEDSVHGLLKSESKRLELDGFDIQNNKILSKSGGLARFAGIARNPGSVKSAFGFKGFWGEEAQTFSAESIKTLTPTGRNKPVKGLPMSMEEVEDGEVDLESMTQVFCVNPGSSEDPFSKRFLTPFWDAVKRDGIYEDDLHLIILINWRDNPWYELSGLEGERRWDLEHLPRALYDHIWEGEFNDSVPNGLIMAEWFDACVDAHKKLGGFEPRGIRKAAHDPSDLGDDPKAFAYRHGNVFLAVEERDDLDVNEGADWATGLALQLGVDAFEWDVGGLGLGLRRDITKDFDGKQVVVSQFNGAESPDFPDAVYQPTLASEITHKDSKTNKQVFRNKRAQYYAELRDRVYRTYRAVVFGELCDPEELISFSSEIKHLSKLRSEMCRMPIKPNSSGLFELYTKQEMRTKFKVKSPNLTDSVMMCIRHVALKRQSQTVAPPQVKRYRTR